MPFPTYQAEFCYGDALQTMEYTPVSAVAAGQVVVIGDIVGIAIRPIEAGKLGTLVIHGGCWKVTGDAAISQGTIVYWNDAADKITATAGSNKKFGLTVTACGGDGQKCVAALLRGV